MPYHYNMTTMQNEVFSNDSSCNLSWKNLYAEIFDIKSLNQQIFENSIVQISMWSLKHHNFYPSYPIYNLAKSPFQNNEEQIIYQEYLECNYVSSFSLSKHIQQYTIIKPIRILITDGGNRVEENNTIDIYLDPNLSDDKLEDLVNNMYFFPSLHIHEDFYRAFLSYVHDLKDKLLKYFSFNTIGIHPVLDHKSHIVGVLSLYTYAKDYDPNHLSNVLLNIAKKITQLNMLISSEEKKDLKPIISSIMSRNISHNIGSHVLVNIEKDMDKTPIAEHKRLINYLLERMNFITQVSTLWSPAWSLPRYFKEEIIQQFLEQRHLLHNIVTTDGLAYQEEYASEYYILKHNKPTHTFTITNSVMIENSSEEINDHDVLVDIPGGKIGYHALYTIIENILRNSAKYGYSSLSKRYQKKHMKFKISIDKESEENQHKVKIWDNVSYISNKLHKFNLNLIPKKIELERIEEVDNQAFVKITIKLNEAHLYLYIHRTLSINGNIQLKPPSADFNYHKEIKKKNTFFFSEARLHSILKHLGEQEEASREDIFVRTQSILKSEEIIHQFLKLLKKRVFKPLHLEVNNSLQAPLTDESKEINENNGLAEIKICALYLSGYNNYDDLDKDYRSAPTPRHYIQAIAVEDYDENNKFLCYRLGYEFVLNKPTVYSLSLSRNYQQRLAFIDQCSDDESFVLINADETLQSKLRTVPHIISSEFLICDLEKFETILNQSHFEDRLNRLPYRIIILLDGDIPKSFNTLAPIYQQRIALLHISKCVDKEKFKTKILNCWIDHLLTLNACNQIDTTIALSGSNTLTHDHNNTEVAEELLRSFVNKLFDNNDINAEQQQDFLETIDDESKSIIDGTKFKRLFQQGENTTQKGQYLAANVSLITFPYQLAHPRPHFSHQQIVLSRHDFSKETALQNLQLPNNKKTLYFEPLSGGTNQFWLYKHMFVDPRNENELLFNKLKLLETALYRIAIFDERLINILEPIQKQAEEQNINVINQINGYGIDEFMGKEGIFPHGLEGTLKNGKFVLTQNNQPVSIDILILHYGLLEKMRDNAKISSDEMKQLLFVCPLVVITSGRGIILENSFLEPERPHGHMKFVSFPVLKEYFKNNSINKIGLTQMLMNLIGIKDNLSGLNDVARN